MKGAHKIFDPGLYAIYDEPAKQAARQYLEAKGYSVTVPPENYGPDLYSFMGEIRLWHEVEVARHWVADRYPYPNSSVPERKIRLVSMVDGPLYFWMFNHKLTHAVVTPGHMLIDRYLIEVPNRLIESGEYFYRVPVQHCRLIETGGQRAEENNDG